MTDYTKLVKALREYSGCRKGEIARITSDAAAAIEDLIESVHIRDKISDELNHYIWELEAKLPHWVIVEERLPEPNVQCLVRDDDNNCAVGYYRQDVKAWDSPFFGWLERDDEYYKDGDLRRIGKVVAWMPIEPPKEDA